MRSDRKLMEAILLGKAEDFLEGLSRASSDDKRHCVFWSATAGNSTALEAVARSVSAALGDAEARRKYFAEIRDGKGRTPLHVAANRQIAWQLWRLGCRLDAKDGAGRTPEQAAHDAVNFELRDYLLSLAKGAEPSKPSEKSTLDLCKEAEQNLLRFAAAPG